VLIEIYPNVSVRKPEINRPVTPRYRYITKRDLEKNHEFRVDWIYLAQDRDWCWAVLKIVMNFYFHKMWIMICLGEELLGLEEYL
jgi:hypothetical protein